LNHEGKAAQEAETRKMRARSKPIKAATLKAEAAATTDSTDLLEDVRPLKMSPSLLQL
jgi:hypothetical protein